MRDKNGRYAKNSQNIIIDIPSPASLVKLAIIIFIFSPWIYIFLFKYDLLKVIEEIFLYLFWPKKIEQSQDCKGKDTPY